MNSFIPKKSRLLTGLSLAVILILLLLLAACGGESDVTSTPADVTSTETDVTSTETDVTSTETDVAQSEYPEEVSTGAETSEEVAAPVDESGISFSEDVMPVLSSSCFQCHGSGRIEGDFVLLSYAEIMAGSRSGAVIVPGDAAASLLVELITTNIMPRQGPKLTLEQVQLITDWVNQGALDN